MKSVTVIVFAFALFVEINSSPKPCDDGCDEGGSYQPVAIPMGGHTSSFKQSKLSFGGPDTLGPVTAAVKTVEDTFDHLVQYGYDLLSGSATGGAKQAAHPPGKETLMVAPVPVHTRGGGGGGGDDSCDECEEKKSESDCDSC